MTIIQIKKKDYYTTSKNARKYSENIYNCIKSLEERDIPESLVAYINSETTQLNELEFGPKKAGNKLYHAYNRIIVQIQKQTNLVPPGYYQNTYMLYGMSFFGLPLGILYALFMDNFGLFGLGLPIGLAVGLAYGRSIDEKTKKEGRQLNFTPQ